MPPARLPAAHPSRVAVRRGLKVPIAVTIGDFLAAWGWVIGVLAGLWFFFTGGMLPGRA